MSGTMELGPGWHLYDTNTGYLIGNVDSGGDRAVGWTQIESTLVDPSGQRLYRLIVPRTSRSWDPSITEHLLADDVTTGEAVGRIDLPGFLAGVVPSVDPLHFGRTPAIAISADGRKLVLVNAIDESVTIISTAGLHVERTIDLRPARDSASQVLAFLGLSPRSATAKGVGGVVLHATFATDGNHLYIWDSSPQRVTPDGQVGLTNRRGLQVINLATGTILHEALADSHILDVVPAPNGDALFVTVATGYDDRGNPSSFALWRLDADLNRVAERTFGVEPHIVIASGS